MAQKNPPGLPCNRGELVFWPELALDCGLVTAIAGTIRRGLIALGSEVIANGRAVTHVAFTFAGAIAFFVIDYVGVNVVAFIMSVF